MYTTSTETIQIISYPKFLSSYLLGTKRKSNEFQLILKISI